MAPEYWKKDVANLGHSRTQETTVNTITGWMDGWMDGETGGREAWEEQTDAAARGP